MQTEKQVIEKIDSMIPDMVEGLKKKVVSLYKSGGVSPEIYSPNDFTLAKILMTAALKYQAWQYTPFSKEGKTIVKNLEHF